jgi:hypothetical protein
MPKGEAGTDVFNTPLLPFTIFQTLTNGPYTCQHIPHSLKAPNFCTAFNRISLPYTGSYSPDIRFRLFFGSISMLS